MNKTLFAAAAAVWLVTAGAAHAQANWTGPYIGAHAGYAVRSDTDGETTPFDTNLDGNFNNTVNNVAGANAFSTGFCSGFPNSNNAPAGCKDDDDKGIDFGVRLGYDWQFGAFVIGALAEVERTRIEDSVTAFSTTPAAYTFSRKLKGVASIKIRGGYAFGDNLVYATGGVARGDFKRSYFTTNTVNSFGQRGGDEPEGYQAGLGFERKIADRVTIGVEWLHTELDDEGYVVRIGPPTAPTNPFILVNPQGTDQIRSDDKFDYDTFRVTTSYRF